MPDRTRPPSPTALAEALEELKASPDFHRLTKAEQDALVESRAHELAAAERDVRPRGDVLR